MFDEKDIAESVRIWHEFVEMTTRELRFFPDHCVIDHVKEVISNDIHRIQAKEKFYRARVFEDESYIDIPEVFKKWIAQVSIDDKDVNDIEHFVSVLSEQLTTGDKIKAIRSGFIGYPKGQNLMPPRIEYEAQGRGNPQYIPGLYLADSVYTAIAEIKSQLKSSVSVAEVTCKKQQNIIDLSYDSEVVENDSLMFLIATEFSKPLKNNKQYISTQIISEVVKKEGYDGIKYNSSLSPGGRNYLFYSDDLFEDINSNLYEINCITAVSKNNIFDDEVIYPKTLNLIINKDIQVPGDRKIDIGQIIKDWIDELRSQD